MPRPIHFEIPAENPERAMQFYSTVFGWKFNKWEGPMDYWIISTGQPGEPGIDGGLMPRRDPNQPCVNMAVSVVERPHRSRGCSCEVTCLWPNK